MKKSLLAICFAAISATSVSAIANNAGSGTITFKGTINSGACTIAPMDLNKEVSLGNINADNLKVSGNTGPQSNFELKLNDCKLDTGEPDEQYSKVEITFSGKAIILMPRYGQIVVLHQMSQLLSLIAMVMQLNQEQNWNKF